MSLKTLIDNIGKNNIAEDVDDQTLVSMGEMVKRQYDRDYDSMSDWIEQVEFGLKLSKQEFHPKSTPWQGASNYKDPLLTEAAIRFGDRAVLELLRSDDLVSASVIGRDPDGQKKVLSERISEAMNYQVNHNMNKWRRTQEKLFYCLPNVGAVFKKTFYNPLDNISESHMIQYPDFVVNQATKSMDSCRSFSQILDFDKNQVEERLNAGLWLDIEVYKGDLKGDKGSNEEAEVLSAMDNPGKFIEQHTFWDLDEDGYEEPYIITIHESSRKVVRVVPRYDIQSITVKFGDVNMKLKKAMDRMREQDISSFGGFRAMSLLGLPQREPDLSRLKVVKIEPLQQITDYTFIPAPDGTFLGLGYSHLLGAIVQSTNTTTNQLTDAATLENLGGGFLSNEFRKEMGVSRLRPGEWKKTSVPADKFVKGVLPNPSKPPSQTLYNLNDKMANRGQQFLAVADMSGQITAQTAPTTALAIIQEGMIPTSALFHRIIEAESNEFQILFRLNQRHFDNETYRQILDDPNANAEQDFNAEGLDIVPTANAERSSKMQRIQTAQLELEQIPLVLQAGGNAIPIIQNYFEAIGSEMSERIFDKGAMTPEEEQMMQQMTQAQEQANQIQMMQLQLLQREQDRLDKETSFKAQEAQQKIKNMSAELIETLTKATKYMEEAESESLKNQITTYTGGLREVIEIMTAIGAENDNRRIAQSVGSSGLEGTSLQ